MRCGLLASLALLVGCVGGQSPTSRLYMLQGPTGAVQTTGSGGVTIRSLAIRDIILPKYLDRPQIVIRRADGEIQLKEFHRWAEPLDTTIERVLAKNLLRRLDLDRSPTSASDRNAELELSVEILAFDLYADGRIELMAQWSVGAQTRRAPIAGALASYEGSASPSDYSAVAQEMSVLIGALGADIASGLVTALTQASRAEDRARIDQQNADDASPDEQPAVDGQDAS